jgi:sec-independent protein translocase protein TatC
MSGEEHPKLPDSPEQPPSESASAGEEVALPDAAGLDGQTPENQDNGTPEDAPGIREGKSMSLMEHLGELRTRLMRVLIVILLGFFACYAFSEALFAELVRPLAASMPQGSKLIFTSIPEAFFVYMKVAFAASLFLTSPYSFYQIWAFVAPGLYEEERRSIVPLAVFSAFFFLAGAAFCYYMVFPLAFDFFMSFATDTILPMPSLDAYLGFALKLLIAFGLIFEMPLFAFFLARIGILTAAHLRRWRKYAVLASVIVGALLTPPDVPSQLIMAAAILVLYEASIWVTALAQKRPQKTDDARKEAPAAGHDHKPQEVL